MIVFLKLTLIATAIATPVACQNSLPTWGYECQKNRCYKAALSSGVRGYGLLICRIICEDEMITLWPKPTGPVTISGELAQIDHRNIRYNFPSNPKTEALWRLVRNRFGAHVDSKLPESDLLSGGLPLEIRISIDQSAEEEAQMPRLTYDTDESYTLRTTKDSKKVYANIASKTFFGARHGLETLLQVIVYDDIRNSLHMFIYTEISDAPVYKHRGLVLNTGRSYIKLRTIRTTIDAMAMSKMNVLHWQITDTTSFPLVIKSHPDLHNLGAYSHRKVYTPEDIAAILEFARSRGVRVIPEFDGAAHAGEGWQKTEMTVCFNAQPWAAYCYEPPCGQLNPTIDELYNVLEDIYREMFEVFDPDIFHMGGDAMSIPCYNSSRNIQQWMRSKGWGLDDADFVKLWGYFQTHALGRVDKVSQRPKMPVILGGEHLIGVIDQFDKSRIILQIPLYSQNYNNADYLSLGLKMIILVSDSPKKMSILNWHTFYDHRPDRAFGKMTSASETAANNLILGSETMIFPEHATDISLNTILWPKVSALAERLWSNPDNNWVKAEPRLFVHREVLVENNIMADVVQLEWCEKNPNGCMFMRFQD